MGTLELIAFRAKREYSTKLCEWKAAESESKTAILAMDKHDRVY